MNQKRERSRNLAVVRGGSPNRAPSTLSMQTGNPTIVVTGAEPGTGKTFVATNLAVALNQLGRKILMANTVHGDDSANRMLGLGPSSVPRSAIEDYMSIHSADEGLLIANHPPARGERDEVGEARRLQNLGHFDPLCDIVVVDTPGDDLARLKQCARSAQRAIVVSTGAESAAAATYALFKSLAEFRATLQVMLIFNRVVAAAPLRQHMQALSESASRYLRLRIAFLGSIPKDPSVQRSVAHRTPLVRYQPDSPAGAALWTLARRLDAETALVPPALEVDHTARGAQQAPAA